MTHGTAARLRNKPIGSHFAQPVHMGRAIESGMLHWLCRSSKKYRVPPNMETVAEVQFKVGPQARKASTCNAPIYKRLVEVHQEFANVGGFIMPSLAELITGGWSPFMKPSNDLTHMNTPKVDNLGISYPAIQYHIKGRPKFATLIRRLEIVTHAVMQDYLAQIESVAGSRIWDKSPGIEVFAETRYQEQFEEDVMYHDLRMLEVEGFQTILFRYARIIYNVNIRELKDPDIATLQNQLLIDTELILPLHTALLP